MGRQHHRRAHGGAGNAAKKLIQSVAWLAGGADDETPPPELQLYWQCQRFNALPDAGALLEQDAGLLARMTLLGSIYEAVERVRGLVGKEIHNMRPSDGRLLMWLEKQGIQV